MVECLYKNAACHCSLRETFEFLKGAKTDPEALKRILGRACPNKPKEQKEQEKKKSPKA